MVQNILTAIAIYLYLVFAWFCIALGWGIYLLLDWALRRWQTKEAIR